MAFDLRCEYRRENFILLLVLTDVSAAILLDLQSPLCFERQQSSLTFRSKVVCQICDGRVTFNVCWKFVILRCRFLKLDQKLATCCRVKYCAKNGLRRYVIRRPLFVQQHCEKSSLRAVSCNTTLILSRFGSANSFKYANLVTVAESMNQLEL